MQIFKPGEHIQFKSWLVSSGTAVMTDGRCFDKLYYYKPYKIVIVSGEIFVFQGKSHADTFLIKRILMNDVLCINQKALNRFEKINSQKLLHSIKTRKPKFKRYKDVHSTIERKSGLTFFILDIRPYSMNKLVHFHYLGCWSDKPLNVSPMVLVDEEAFFNTNHYENLWDEA